MTGCLLVHGPPPYLTIHPLSTKQKPLPVGGAIVVQVTGPFDFHLPILLPTGEEFPERVPWLFVPRGALARYNPGMCDTPLRSRPQFFRYALPLAAATLLVVVLSAICLFMSSAQAPPAKEPAPFVPSTEFERKVIALANAFVGRSDPIGLYPGLNPGTYRVAYPMPHFETREYQLLGNKYVIVNSETEAVEWGMRD